MTYLPCPRCGSQTDYIMVYCPACGLQLSQVDPPVFSQPPRPAQAFQYAGFWRRLAACVIDQLLLCLFAGLVFLLYGLWAYHALRTNGPALQRPFAAAAGFGAPRTGASWGRGEAAAVGILAGWAQACGWYLLAKWVYYAALESSPWQATLGKRALGLRVTDVYGQRISFGRACARHFAKILSQLTLGMGYLLAGWTPQKQALHDLMARTLVVSSPR
ncbi:MAG: RDD family protein [Alicyclobacillus sp.]|nr:RDD family protein [Alicyclobacillus sp.]